MSKTDEMFEGLGYKKIEENIYENAIEHVEYRKIIENNGFTTIVKTIEIYNPKFYIKPFINLTEINTDTYTKDSFNLSVQELQAINEKVKELGWLMNKELEEAIKKLKELKTDVELGFGGWTNRLNEKEQKAIETVLKELERLQEDYMPKDKIREKIEEVETRNYNDFTNRQDGNEIKYRILNEFKELLEEK